MNGTVVRRSTLPGFGLTMGLTLTWLSVIILIPLAGLFLKTFELSFDQFWGIATSRRTLNALKISFGLSFAAALVNLVMGTVIVWALVRYRFPGRRLFDAIVDIPFALPTAVAGIALSSLFAQQGWLGAPLAELGIKVAFTPAGIFIAMIFIGIPFVVRTVQPVLIDLDPEIEEAAASLGANRWHTVFRVILPNVRSAVLGGAFGEANRHGDGQRIGIFHLAAFETYQGDTPVNGSLGIELCQKPGAVQERRGSRRVRLRRPFERGAQLVAGNRNRH